MQPQVVCDRIQTPALLVDFDALSRNLDRMARFFSDRQTGLRPHFKTHKIPLIAHLQLARGAIGITCAKTGEAETLIRSGIPDVLIANQVVAQDKIARLAGLARIGRITACVDAAANAHDLSRIATAMGVDLGVCVEVDVGMGRCGTRSTEQTVRLSSLTDGLPGLRFSGLVGYEGNAVLVSPREERARLCKSANGTLLQHAAAVRDAGLECAVVSGGGTGTYDMTGTCPGITDVQAGSYVFMDATYRGIVDFERALTVLTTVISRPEPDRAVIDAGIKAVTREFGLPQPVGIEGAHLVSLSEEHGVLELSGHAQRLVPGDTVELEPTHCCTTVNLHDCIAVIRERRVIDVWPVMARGQCR